MKNNIWIPPKKDIIDNDFETDFFTDEIWNELYNEIVEAEDDSNFFYLGFSVFQNCKLKYSFPDDMNIWKEDFQTTFNQVAEDIKNRNQSFDLFKDRARREVNSLMISIEIVQAKKNIRD